MAKLKILVVDDSSFMRKQIINSLSLMGYHNFYEAGSGKEAVEQYKKNNPDLVLLDIIIDKKDTGLDVLKQIKEFDKNANVIMVSVVDQKDIKQKAKKLGASGYITKPIVDDKFLKQVRKTVKLKKHPLHSLEKVATASSKEVSKAFSNMVKKKIDVTSKAEIVSFSDIQEKLGAEEDSLVLYTISKTSEISIGLAMISMKNKDALALVDLLIGREIGTTKSIQKIERSALLELANVLAGASYNAIVSLSHFSLVSSQPFNIRENGVGSAVKSFLTKNQSYGEGIVFRNEFHITKHKIKVNLALLFQKGLLNLLENVIK